MDGAMIWRMIGNKCRAGHADAVSAVVNMNAETLVSTGQTTLPGGISIPATPSKVSGHVVKILAHKFRATFRTLHGINTEFDYLKNTGAITFYGEGNEGGKVSHVEFVDL